MAETGAAGNTAVAADLPANTAKPAWPTTRKKTKLVEVREAYILERMWRKACRPRHDFPTWKPGPDTRVELVRSHEKAVAIIYESHRHEDDLILQYITNGRAYEELEIGDDHEE